MINISNLPQGALQSVQHITLSIPKDNRIREKKTFEG